MTFRPAPLRAAAALAVVFIVARVIYRILFNGAGIGEPVLLDLPALRLPAPYAHVVLLGPVTAPGLWAAVLSALPIAGMFLGFGLLNAWVDVARGFVHLARRGLRHHPQGRHVPGRLQQNARRFCLLVTLG